MALPIDFEGRNDMLKKPQNMTEEQCMDLPIFRDISADSKNATFNRTVSSCWELTPEEFAEVAKTGRVYITAYGVTHPPISVSAYNPSVKPHVIKVNVHDSLMETYGFEASRVANVNEGTTEAEGSFMILVERADVFQRLKENNKKIVVFDTPYFYTAKGQEERGTLVGCKVSAIDLRNTKGWVAITFSHIDVQEG